MASTETMSIALPVEMATRVREAVDGGEYASNSDVIREAVREWTAKRGRERENIEHLRAAWTEAIREQKPGFAVDEILDRLERRYKALEDETGRKIAD